MRVVLFEVESFSGYLNMAFDNLLFNNFEKIFHKDTIIIRFYTFANHTITLGYFQRRINDEVLKLFEKWAKIRRITGGKAVFHHPKKDLVMSLISSINCIQKLIQKNQNIIKEVHYFINNKIWEAIKKEKLSETIEFLQNDFNLNSEYNDKKFNCFSNPQKFEKTYQGKKVIGTAIKISQDKIIIQANIKLQTVFPNLDKSFYYKIQNNFTDILRREFPEIVLKREKLSSFLIDNHRNLTCFSENSLFFPRKSNRFVTV